jgi:hypothetical protein
MMAQSSRNARAGLTIKLPDKAAGLSSGDVVFGVVRSDSVTIRPIRRPPGLQAEDVVDVLNAGLTALTAEDAPALTAEEARVLASGGLDASALRLDEIAPIFRTGAEHRRLLASSLSVEQTARLLGVNASRIRQRLTAQPPSLYGIKDGKRWRVPRFQFAGRKAIPGIAAVVAALPTSLHPVAVYRWLTSVNPDLYRDRKEEHAISPLDWLRTGGSPDVAADLARAL